MAETRAYGATTRWLHWLTVAALVAQFTVGYLMAGDDSSRRPSPPHSSGWPPPPSGCC